MKLSLIRLILFQFEFIDSSVIEQREHSNHKLPFKKRKLESIQTDNLSFLTKTYGNFQYPDMCATTNNSLINKTDVVVSESITCISKANNDNSINRDVPELNSPKNDKKIAMKKNHQYLIYMNIEGESNSKQIYGDERNDPSSIGENSMSLMKQAKANDSSNDTPHINGKIQFKPNKDWPILLNKEESEKLKNLLSGLHKKLIGYKGGSRYYYTPKFNRACTMFSEVFIILCLGIKNEENEETLKKFFESFYAKFKEHKISFKNNNIIFYKIKKEIRQEIVEVLKKELSNYDDKIKIYEKLIELEKKSI